MNKISTAFICILSFSFGLYAQNANIITDSLKTFEMPSITVSTTKADVNTPVPYRVIEKSEIANNYSTNDTPALIAGQPSVIFYSESGNSVGYSNLTMRGFNQRRISVMINGIPQNDPEDHNVYWIDFPDLSSNLESIEIQRGAGLINYGSAAIGGSINLTTSSFVEKKGLTVSTGAGFQEFGNDVKLNVNKQSIEFSSGLTGNHAFYGRLSRIYSNGYRDRSWSELNSYFFSGVIFNDLITTQVNIFGGPINDGLAYGGSPKSWTNNLQKRRKNLSYWSYDSTGRNVDYTQERSEAETEKFSQPHFEILNDFRLGDTDNHFLSSLFYYQGDGHFDYDGSWADTSMLRITYEQGFSPKQNPMGTIIRGAVENKQAGWIPRLLLNHDGGEFLIGAEIRFHNSRHFGKIAYASGLPDDYDQNFNIYEYRGIRNIFSLFAREKYNLTDNLMAYGEIQLTRSNYAIDDEKSGRHFTKYKSVDGTIVGNGDKLFDIPYFFINPRVGINYSIDTDNKLYAFAAITNREPRMRNLYPADDSYFGAQPLFKGQFLMTGEAAYDFTKPIAKPESMLDIEAGWNYRYKNLFLNLNLYWMDYSNELVKSGQLDIFGNPVEGNAEKTRHYGFELSAGINELNTDFGKFGFSGNFTLSRNKIIKYDWLIGVDSLGNKLILPLAGNDISGFPDMMGNFSMHYNWNNLYLNVLFHVVGSYRTDNFGEMITTEPLLRNYLGNGYYSDNTLDSYSFLNANLSYSIYGFCSVRELRLRFQTNNILNSLYNAGAEGKDFFPAAERNFYLGVEIGL